MVVTAQAGPTEYSVSVPPGYNGSSEKFPVVYLLGEEDTDPLMAIVSPHFGKDCHPFILAGIGSKDWNTSFSPWPAGKLGKSLGPFSGGGPQFLDHVIHDIKPAVDSAYRTLPGPEQTAAAGYSLAGLLAFYSMYTIPSFGRFACMSGSLWFPGWTGFVQHNRPLAGHPRIYVSLGNKEQESRNPVMSSVADCTEKTLAALAPYSPEFESTTGGHFCCIPERIAKGLISIMG